MLARKCQGVFCLCDLLCDAESGLLLHFFHPYFSFPTYTTPHCRRRAPLSYGQHAAQVQSCVSPVASGYFHSVSVMLLWSLYERGNKNE